MHRKIKYVPYCVYSCGYLCMEELLYHCGCSITTATPPVEICNINNWHSIINTRSSWNCILNLFEMVCALLTSLPAVLRTENCLLFHQSSSMYDCYLILLLSVLPYSQSPVIIVWWCTGNPTSLGPSRVCQSNSLHFSQTIILPKCVNKKKKKKQKTGS